MISLSLPVPVHVARVTRQALQDLQGVLVPQHLQTNRIAQAALAGRHRVQLSAAAAELLMRFLHSARLTLLLALINEYLELAVSRLDRCWRAPLAPNRRRI